MLKVAHHGSARQDPDLVRATGARLAVISVGVGQRLRPPGSLVDGAAARRAACGSRAPTGTVTWRSSWTARSRVAGRGHVSAGAASVTGWRRDDVHLLPGRRVRQRPARRATRWRWCTTRPASTTSRWPRSRAGRTSPRRRSCCRRAGPGCRLPAADLHARRGAALRRSPDAGQRPRLARAPGAVPATTDRVVQECGVGLVELRRDERRPRLPGTRLPAHRRRSTRRPSAGWWARSGSRPAQVVRGLAGSTTAPAGSGSSSTARTTCSALRPDFVALERRTIGVIGPLDPRSVRQRGCRREVRAFCPGLGINEDPVTGSLNAGFAVWLTRDGAPAAVVRRPPGDRARSGRSGA